MSAGSQFIVGRVKRAVHAPLGVAAAPAYRAAEAMLFLCIVDRVARFFAVEWRPSSSDMGEVLDRRVPPRRRWQVRRQAAPEARRRRGANARAGAQGRADNSIQGAPWCRSRGRAFRRASTDDRHSASGRIHQ
jgi:hypothetical protein